MPEPMLSAVIACYRDAPAIPEMHRRLSAVFAALGVSYEIIFVNDASPDDADRVLAVLAAEDDRVLAIEHSRNFGAQNALLSGMELARGDAVILLDGDLQDPPELIADLYAKWREGNDVVYARRTEREGSALMALCARIFYRVFRGLAEVPMPLDAGDFGLIDRRVVNEILALPETDQFIRGLRAWVGFKQAGVDHVRPRRVFGHSNHSLLRMVWWAKKAIFSFSFAPIEIIGYGAATLTALGACLVGYELYSALWQPEASRSMRLAIALIVFFGSLNLLAVAVVGEYVIRILQEAKRRPKFIRKAIRYRGQRLATAAAISDFVSRRSRDEARASASVSATGGHES